VVLQAIERSTAVTVHSAVAVYRRQIVALIESSPNKRAACAAAGVHPSTFYRWRNKVDLPSGEVRSVPWIEYRLEQQVVAAALASPAAGPQRLADELTSIGVDVNPSKVWRILKRHRLNTRRLRYALLTHHRNVTDGFTVADRARTYVGVLEASQPGDLVQFDCFHVGSFKETRLKRGKQIKGQIWQYTAIDVASSYTWAELHATSHNPSQVLTSQLAHRVAADLTANGWTWRAASTDNGNEFRAQQFTNTLASLGVTQRFIKAGRPQTNGKVERVQRTILEECYQPALIGYTEPSITGLRQDLTNYLTYYNHQRHHHGKWNQGATPASILIPNPKLHP
jgi:transposase InsO family protein